MSKTIVINNSFSNSTNVLTTALLFNCCDHFHDRRLQTQTKYYNLLLTWWNWQMFLSDTYSNVLYISHDSNMEKSCDVIPALTEQFTVINACLWILCNRCKIAKIDIMSLMWKIITHCKSALKSTIVHEANWERFSQYCEIGGKAADIFQDA